MSCDIMLCGHLKKKRDWTSKNSWSRLARQYLCLRDWTKTKQVTYATIRGMNLSAEVTPGYVYICLFMSACILVDVITATFT